MSEVNAQGMTFEEAAAAITAPGAPYELETREVRGQALRCFVHAPNDLHVLYRQSLEHGDKTFLVYEDERYTFAQVYASACALGDQLIRRYGLSEGDRVALAMRNYPEWVYAYMAITACGLVAVPMNAWWTQDEMVYGLEDSGARMLIVDAERMERIAPRLEELGLACAVARARQEPTAGVERLESLLEAGQGRSMPEARIHPDDDAVIMYTSGTTGFPKGAVSTHRAVVHSAMAFESGLALARLRDPQRAAPAYDPSILLTVPLFHVTGCNAIFLASFRPGRKMILMYRWDPEKALELIERERATSFTGVPTMTWEMLQSPNFERYDTSSLMAIGGGGAPAPPELVRQVEARFQGRPGIGYGLTETNAVGAQNGGDDYLERPRSTGRPPVCVDIEAFDDDHEQLPRGSLGEISVRGPVVFRGYWNRPEATAESLIDGWFRTGDIGRVDADGFVYIEDRKKDMVIRGGENVYCAEVEAALYELEGVFEATVFGVPDERLGEKVAAVVVAKDGHVLRPEEVREQLAARLACPRRGDRADAGVADPFMRRMRRSPAVRMGRSVWMAACALPALALTACGPTDPPGDDDAGDRPGERVYTRFCYSCHEYGGGGAPKVGDIAAWSARLEKGRDMLIQHTREGYRGMPAKGLCRRCSDAELRAAVEYMLRRSTGEPATEADGG